MENLDKNIFDDSSLGINNQSKELLKTIVFWSKFISIVGLFVTIGFSLLFVLMIVGREMRLGDAVPFWVFSALCIIPLVYLFLFARKIEQTLRESDSNILQKAIQNLKSYFKSIGVVIILTFVCLIILVIVGSGYFSTSPVSVPPF